jgi:hypothetical protein
MMRRIAIRRCAAGARGQPPPPPVSDQAFMQELEAELAEMDAKASANRVLDKIRPKEPLLSRWWVPYACILGIVAIWTPDKYKVRALYYADDAHDRFKLWVHTWYWWATMPTEKYSLLMEQLAANVPKSERVQSTDCPL